MRDSDFETLFDDLGNDCLDEDVDKDDGFDLAALGTAVLSKSIALSNDNEDTCAEVGSGDETEDGEGGGEGEDNGGGEGDVGCGTRSFGSCLALASLEPTPTPLSSALSSESLPKMS